MNFDKWSTFTAAQRQAVLDNQWQTLDSGFRQNSTFISYSFLTSADGRHFQGYVPQGEALNFVAFNQTEKAFATFLFDYLESFLNLDFLQTFGNSGKIGLGKHNMTPGGYADYPHSGDMGLFVASDSVGASYGQFALGTITHELGHSLGLSHPVNYDGSSRFHPSLDKDLDTSILTIMSYNDWYQTSDVKAGYVSTFRPLDIAALTNIYGARTSNENNVFSLSLDPNALPSKSGVVWTVPVTLAFVIVDTGGHDLIDASKLVSATSPLEAFFSFDEGLSSSVVPRGEVFDYADKKWLDLNNESAIRQVEIFSGTVIEEYWGTLVRDVVDGNAADQIIRAMSGNDQIFGRGGNDVIDGGDGVDVAVFSDNRANLSLTKNSDGSLSITGAVDGSDQLINIEKLQFLDLGYNLQAAQKAASIDSASLNNLIDLYVAYFNRVPEASGLIYWIDQLAGGKSLDQIAIEFYAAGIQNSDVTGYTSTMPLSAFIEILYKNVLGREGDKSPSSSEISYWENEVATGQVTREGLVQRFLLDARKFYDDPDVGFVPLLLDKKIEFGMLHAVTYGVDYNDDTTAIQKTVGFAAAVTPTSIDAAVALVGLGADDYIV